MQSTHICLLFFLISTLLTLPASAYPNSNVDAPASTNDTKKGGKELGSMYQLQESVPLPKREGRLQGVSVKGRLMCGSEPIVGGRVKIVDIDKSGFFGMEIFGIKFWPCKFFDKILLLHGS
jgi:hypothetical protein